MTPRQNHSESPGEDRAHNLYVPRQRRPRAPYDEEHGHLKKQGEKRRQQQEAGAVRFAGIEALLAGCDRGRKNGRGAPGPARGPRRRRRPATIARATMPAARSGSCDSDVPDSASTGAIAASPPTTNQPIPEHTHRLALCRPQAPRPSRAARITPPDAPINRSNPATNATHASSRVPPRWPSRAARMPSAMPTTAPLTRAAR